MLERDIQNKILLAAGSRNDTRLFRQDVGNGWQGKVAQHMDGRVILDYPRRVSYGLCKGSSDLIGWQTIEITPDMVGKKVARFVALEVKTPPGKVSPEQENFINRVNAAGGKAGVVKSEEEAVSLLT